MPRIPKLRRKQADEPAVAQPSKAARGQSGRFHTDGFLDYDEVNTSLAGLAGLQVFDEMWRTDVDCRRALGMCIVPIVAGTWTVEPWRDSPDADVTDEDREAAELVEHALCEHMRPRLPLHLWQALAVAGRGGAAPFEQVWEHTTWRGRDVLIPKTLDIRLPKTIQRWRQNGSELESIEQLLVDKTVDIPAQDLVVYRFGAEGDNWEGQSLLRPAYWNWKAKRAIEQVTAIGVERTLVGVPTGYPPTSAQPDQLDEFEEFLAGVRANEAAYFMAPGPRADHAKTPNGTEGWFWEFVTPQGGESVAKMAEFLLQYHTGKIDAAILAEFMRLGQQGVGARATADVQQNPFYLLVESLCTIVIEDPLNDMVVRRIIDLNYGHGRYPRVRCSEIDPVSLDALATAVATLVDKQVIRVEPTLEAYLRDKLGLPEADEEAIAEREQLEAEKAAEQFERDKEMAEHAAKLKPAPATAPAAAAPKPAGAAKKLDTSPDDTVTLARQDRELRAWERPMQLDVIEQRIDDARERLQAAAGPAAREHAIAIARALQAGKKPPAAPRELADAVRAELDDLYRTGRATVRAELERQAMDRALGAFTLDTGDDHLPERLADRAFAIVDAITAGVTGAVRKLLLRGAQLDATVQAGAEQAAQQAVRAEAMEHAMPALNEGRRDQADDLADQIAGARYTSILDGRRCTSCAVADDDVLRPLNDPVRLARVPPNPDCHGGGRCRCLEAFQLADEAAPDA